MTFVPLLEGMESNKAFLGNKIVIFDYYGTITLAGPP